MAFDLHYLCHQLADADINPSIVQDARSANSSSCSDLQQFHAYRVSEGWEGCTFHVSSLTFQTHSICHRPAGCDLKTGSSAARTLDLMVLIHGVTCRMFKHPERLSHKKGAQSAKAQWLCICILSAIRLQQVTSRPAPSTARTLIPMMCIHCNACSMQGA